MKNSANRGFLTTSWAWLSVVVLLCLSIRTQATEDKFDLLSTKTDVYKNVIVTSQTKTDVYILHSRGMCNLKVTDLSQESLRQLGYIKDPENANAASGLTVDTGSPSAQAATTTKQLNEQLSVGIQKMRAAGRNVLIVSAAVLLLTYLFLCHCFSLICRKTGVDAGILVWLPILQLVPLLRAAGMSPVWILAWFVPGLNLIAQIVWSFKITQAREKSAWVAIFLLLPVTNLIALLYLAFSEGPSTKVDLISSGPLVFDTN